ncbi:MAG: hypothetical protein CHACPFDD_00896 [Phycisphaerae bacterium]|nr:hypothetical protein [Phycisphaerae bacterium]
MKQQIGAWSYTPEEDTRRKGAKSRGTYRQSEYARTKPEGGFCFIPAMVIIGAWWAFRARFVTLGDLRVWLAFFEVVARRCGDRPNRSLNSVEHELIDLVDGSEAQVRTSIRRLERAGLLLRNRTTSRWYRLPEPPAADEQENLAATIRGVENHRRRAPVPRRVIRYLCRATRPVLWATVLGHVLRCLYYRNGQCAPDGRCKSSWVADVFEVDPRNVKAARRELVELGVLIMEPTDQRSMNRFGPRVRFNLEWNGVPACRRPPPPRPSFTAGSPPPKKDRELASRWEDQKPWPAAGVRERSPRWRVAPSDLDSPNGLGKLFEQLVACGACKAGEAARLNLFAAAARTRRVATRNPAGFLAALVRWKHWDFASHADEEAGRAWLIELRKQRYALGQVSEPQTSRDVSRPQSREPVRAANMLQAVLSSTTASARFIAPSSRAETEAAIRK